MLKKSYRVLIQHFFLVAVWGIVLYGLYTRMNEREAIYRQNALHDVELEFRAVRQSYDMLSQHVYDNDINDDKVTKIMAAAMRTHAPETLRDLRQQLLQRLAPLYKNLKKQHIRQLHFHLPKGISFARFHRPDKYGDSLWAIRYSIRKVNETREPLTGFEEGRVFNGFRHVFPLFDGTTFVGTVEVSYSFSAVEEAVIRLFPAVYSLILHEAPIRTKVWSEEMQNYSRSDLSDDYYYDVAAQRTLQSRSDVIIDHETVLRINRTIRPQIGAHLAEGAPFNVVATADARGYLVNFLPVYNVEGRHVAYFIAYVRDRTTQRLYRDFITESVGVTFAVGLIAIIGILYRQNRDNLSEKLQWLRRAHTDTLTGINNRQGFLATVERLLGESRQNRNEVAVIFFDIDLFKEINDRHGHNAGDTALVELAARVQRSLRRSDYFARWGGEEFVILLPGTSSDQAVKIAEKLRRQIAVHPFSHGSMSCSFGVTQTKPDDDRDSLIQRVDTALYNAKEEGRNRVSLL